MTSSSAREPSAPLVSVIMASHNGAPFVAEAIDSVLGQSYGPLELVVVDDGSSDDTAEIVAAYAGRDAERVRLMRKDQCQGPCRARNDALRLVRGRLVCWMDQDDVWASSKVGEQVRLMEQRPEVGLVYSYFEAFDSDTGEAIPWPDARRDIEGDVLADLLLIGCFIGSITTMFRREALERRGGRLRERDFSLGDDYFLWLTIALDWQVARIPRVLATYRRHAANESTRIESTMDFERWRMGLLHEFFDQFPEAAARLGQRERVALAWQLIRAARLELLRGHVGQARRDRERAALLDPAILGRSWLGMRSPRASRS